MRKHIESMAERRLTLGEEIANSVTHGIGFLLSIAALVFLVVITSLRGDVWQVVSCSIYGGSLVLLYACSTLYHSLTAARAKHVFRVLDHSSIYVLIAGTYTPFLLVGLRHTAVGWILLAIVWLAAAVGIVMKAVVRRRWAVLSTALYILLGWVALFAARPILAFLGWHGFLWLLAGGLAYTLGVVFFASERVRYAHAVWHLFVMAGSVCHFLAILFYVVPSLIRS